MSDFAADVRRGLNATPKFLLPIYFYDALGSALFDAICELPEYYVTRAETSILTEFAPEMVQAFGPPIRLVELGSGSAKKTRLLLDALHGDVEYVPVDVDSTMLAKTEQSLKLDYPRLRVHSISSDFRAPSVALKSVLKNDVRNIVLFLGSTIGNLTYDEAVSMLRDLPGVLQDGDALFLGADLRKPKSILEPAYDDPLGVTASFNLNLLSRINRELGGNFDLAKFAHRAFYDEQRGRVEMHLVSREAQRVRIEDYEVSFAAGETIHTENSYKYDDATLTRLAAESGFSIEQKWTDSQGLFADVLLRVCGGM